MEKLQSFEYKGTPVYVRRGHYRNMPLELQGENDMWNTKSDTFGWNLDRDTSNLNYHCNFCKEDNKCAMSSLIHCDYRKDGKCTHCKGK